jgi:hypothetical protein
MTLTHYIIAIIFLLLFIVCLLVAVADAMRTEWEIKRWSKNFFGDHDNDTRD